MKLNFSDALDKLSMGKRIKTLRILEFFLDHTWATIPVLALNLAFTWFFILMGKISGFFDIITLVIFPFLLIIGEIAILLFSVFPEIVAEMISDSIFPRYTEFPRALLKPQAAPAAKAPAEPAKAEPAAAPAKPAYQPKNPRYGNAAKPVAASTPAKPAPKVTTFKPDLTERLNKIKARQAIEGKLCTVIAPAVAGYRDAMKARDCEVPAGEMRLLWLVLTRLIVKDQAETLTDARSFATCAIQAMETDMPEIVENWTQQAMVDEYFRLDQVINDSKARINPDHDDVTKEIIATLSTFISHANRVDDYEAEALLEKSVLSAVEKAAELI